MRPRDPQALGEAILDIVGDEGVRDSLARGARERAASLFTMERFRTTHRALYGVSGNGNGRAPEALEDENDARAASLELSIRSAAMEVHN